ncbi:MAG: DUF4185 domain-containing protein [Proteobacteria bacterium]|nr:DUF4185 domain-containing protein [Pseudomonadota bacterium]
MKYTIKSTQSSNVFLNLLFVVVASAFVSTCGPSMPRPSVSPEIVEEPKPALAPVQAGPIDGIRTLYIADMENEQEKIVKQHLIELDMHAVTVMAPAQVETAAIDRYSLIIISGFSDISNNALSAIQNARRPLLLIDRAGFSYSKRMGLIRGENATDMNLVSAKPIGRVQFDILELPASKVRIYDEPSQASVVPIRSLRKGSIPLLVSGNGATIVAFPKRRMIVTGLRETTRYTPNAWRLFDKSLNYLHRIGPVWKSLIALYNAYEESGIASFIELVKSDPDSYTKENVASEIWPKVLKWNLFKCRQLISIELAHVDKLKPIPGVWVKQWFNNLHPPRKKKNKTERWFLGQHRNINSLKAPALGTLVKGTDLGISVFFKDKTIFYLGDTSGTFSTKRCDQDLKGNCNDAIAVSYDTNWSDGVDVYLVTEQQDGEMKFLPQAIPGVHSSRTKAITRFGPYSTPTGAAVISRKDEFKKASSSVVMWYATYSKAPADKLNRKASWVGCSPNGFDFQSCYPTGQGNSMVPFSRDKFIQVSPVPISSKDFELVCSSNPDSILCNLPEDASRNGGLLLFGNGERYRCSSLYLGFIPLNDIGTLHKVRGEQRPFVYYFAKNNNWSFEENEASPIIEIDENRCINMKTTKSPLWCYSSSAGDKCKKGPARISAFGELSVALVRKGLAQGEAPYLVMLSNHGGLPVMYRAASLISPHRWGRPRKTRAAGYGPYIIEKSISVSDGALHLYYVISVWKGPKSLTPYGVYTRPLLLVEDRQKILPEWPPASD